MRLFYPLCICYLAILFSPLPLLATEQVAADVKTFEKMFPRDNPSEKDIYQTEITIEYVNNQPSPTQNFGEPEGQSVELELGYRSNDNLKVRSNIAYQQLTNDKTNFPIPVAPEYQFYMNPSWTFLPDWSLDGQLYWVGGCHRPQGNLRNDIDDYTTVDLTLRRKNIIKNFELALAVRNLFDKDVHAPSPYDPTEPLSAHIPDDSPMEGRAIWLELRARF